MFISALQVTRAIILLRPLAVSIHIAEVWFDIALGESTGQVSLGCGLQQRPLRLTGSRRDGDDLDRAAEAVTGTIIMVLRLAVSPQIAEVWFDRLCGNDPSSKRTTDAKSERTVAPARGPSKVGRRHSRVRFEASSEVAVLGVTQLHRNIRESQLSLQEHRFRAAHALVLEELHGSYAKRELELPAEMESTQTGDCRQLPQIGDRRDVGPQRLEEALSGLPRQTPRSARWQLVHPAAPVQQMSHQRHCSSLKN
jgi:hypothetical protein